MDLTTKYMGLKLRNPLVPSASPLMENIDNLKRMEDAGASAVVLHSLFEEQLTEDKASIEDSLSKGEGFSEASSFFPAQDEYRLGPEEYLSHIAKAKQTVKIPVIASLNGSTNGGWIDYAKDIEKAGADALELNVYQIPTDFKTTATQVEECYLDIVKAVRQTVSIPLAVKFSPYFSSFANMAKHVDDAGVNGLVLFNRFYQPDIDLESLEVKPSVLLSTPQARRLPLRWIAILYGNVKADLAATSGIHNAQDVVKMLMAGAKITMLCSVLLKQGIGHISQIEADLKRWLEENEYASVKELCGTMSQKKCPDPSAFERAQYMKVLCSYKTA
jgi:dihydroorotate dehydrogenase (fumarate)